MDENAINWLMLSKLYDAEGNEIRVSDLFEAFYTLAKQRLLSEVVAKEPYRLAHGTDGSEIVMHGNSIPLVDKQDSSQNG